MKRIIVSILKHFVKTIKTYSKLMSSIKNKNEKKFLESIKKIDEILEIKVNIVGKEKLNGLDKFVIFCNHQSMFDPVFVIDALNTNISFVAKKELEKSKIIKKVFDFNRSVYLDRDDPKDALKKILELNKRLKEEDICKVGVFPEGTRAKSNTLGEFKAGSFKLGTKEKVPLVIMSIKDAINLEHTCEKKEVTLTIIDILEYEDYKDMKTPELAEYCKTLIEKNLN